MTGLQYEELCRLFLADQLGCSIDDIVTGNIENPTRKGQPEFAHQVDLYWKIEDNLSKFVIIANAKWRKPTHQGVGLEEVLLIQKIREAIGAHKAVLLTNSSFTEGALAAAVQWGVALHIVRPTFDWGRLHPSEPLQIRGQLQALARRASPAVLFTHEAIHKGLGLGPAPVDAVAQPAAVVSTPSAALPTGRVTGPPIPYQHKSLAVGAAVAPSAPPTILAPVPRGGGLRYRTK